MTDDSEMRLTDKGRARRGWWASGCARTHRQFDAFFCSQYVRTKETAAEMNLPNANWHADLMIRERDQGVQDGGGDVKLGLDDEEQYRMEKSPMYWQPIAGESMADVVTRVRHFLQTLSECSAGLCVVVVCHYRTIHAFRILLEEIPQEQYADLLKETMPNCCIWWYSRRDLEGGQVHWQVASVKRIAVQRGWHAEIIAKPITRKIFSNATLLQQIAPISQVVNNGPDGKGQQIRPWGSPRAGTPRRRWSPAAVSGDLDAQGRPQPPSNQKSVTGALLRRGARGRPDRPRDAHGDAAHRRHLRSDGRPRQEEALPGALPALPARAPAAAR